MEETKKELLHTYGFDLLQVIEDAKANGNPDFAELVEKQVANLQACYDVLSQKYTSTGGENVWNIDALYLQGMLK